MSSPTLNAIPPELQLKIFRTACLDDGSTGRSLSTVSKYISDISSEFRYQSMALAGEHQIRTFRNILERAFLSPPVVKHLFITDEYGDLTGYDHFTIDAQDLIGLTACSLLTLTIVPSKFFYTINRQNFVSMDILRDLKLPQLLELTVRREKELPQSDSFAPNLQMLHIAEDSWLEQCYTPVCRYYPSLRRYCGPLNYRIVSSFRTLARTRTSLGYPDYDYRAIFRCVPLHSEEAEDFRYQMMLDTEDHCRNLARSSNGLFSISISQDTQPSVRSLLLREEWLSRLDGRLGCWAVVG